MGEDAKVGEEGGELMDYLASLKITVVCHSPSLPSLCLPPLPLSRSLPHPLFQSMFSSNMVDELEESGQTRQHRHNTMNISEKRNRRWAR